MDAEAKPIGNDIWLITNLVGRPIGSVTMTGRGFVVETDDGSPIKNLPELPFKTLDLALSAIEKAIQGRCQMIPG